MTDTHASHGMPNWQSLHVRLGGALLLLFVAIAGGLSLFLSLETQQRIEHEMTVRGALLLDGLAEALTATRERSIDSTVSAFAAESDVESILLVGADGVVLAATNSQWLDREVGSFLPAERARQVLRVVNERVGRPEFERGSNHYVQMRRVDLMPSDGSVRRRAAVLLLELDSKRAAQDARAWAVRRAGFTLLAVAAAALLVYVLLRRLVLRPIARLQRTMLARRSDERVRAEESEPGEFGDLAADLNTLLDQNAGQREELAARGESLRASWAQYQALVLASPVGIVVHRTGVPVFANDAAAQVFGHRSSADVLALPAIDGLFGAPMDMDATPHGDAPWELDVLRPDGAAVRVELRARVVDWEGEDAVMLLLADVSERHAVGQALRRARDEALALATLRSRFLANMSHELRTPMNGVLGVLGMLAETPLADGQRELIDTAQRAGEALIDRVNDVLEFSRLEAGGLTLVPQPTDLRTLVDDALELQIVAAQRNRVELACVFETTQPCRVQVDPSRVRQILVNLVGNAVKFTHDGDVSVRVYETGDALNIDVRDGGVGIPAGALERIFEPFVQADSSTTRRFGGTGLGLSICRRLAQLMGGDIAVRSREGVGSTFTLRLPAAVRLAAPRVPDAGAQALVCSASALRIAALGNALGALGWAWRACAEPSALPAAARGCAAVILDEDLLGGVPRAGHWASALAALARIEAPPRLLRLSAFVGAVGDAAEALASRLHFDGVLRRPVRLASLRERLVDDTHASGQPQTHGRGHASRTVEAHERRLAEARRPGRELTDERAAMPAHRRALVVDDVELNREVLMRMLERLGFAVDVACDGERALEAVGRGDYALVLMDCEMPRMDGYEATARIRALPPPRAATHIVAVTANALAGDEARCLDAGMDDYLAKPVTLARLRDVVDRWSARVDTDTTKEETPAVIAHAALTGAPRRPAAHP